MDQFTSNQDQNDPRPTDIMEYISPVETSHFCDICLSVCLTVCPLFTQNWNAVEESSYFVEGYFSHE